MNPFKAGVGLVISIMLLISLFVYVGAPKNTETLDKLARGIPKWAEDGFLLEDGKSMILLTKYGVTWYQPDGLLGEGVRRGIRYEAIGDIERDGVTYTVRSDENAEEQLVFAPGSGYDDDADRVMARLRAELAKYEEIDE